MVSRQQNSKSKLYGVKNETFKYIVRGICKLALKNYKSRYDWVGRLRPSELCKRLIFDNTLQCHMHKPESVLDILRIWNYKKCRLILGKEQTWYQFTKKKLCAYFGRIYILIFLK